MAENDQEMKHALLTRLGELQKEITRLRESKSSLRRNINSLEHELSKYRILLESLPFEISIKDKNNKYLSCNQNFAGSFRISPDEIAGKTDYDLYPKELADKYASYDRNVVNSGRLYNFEENKIKGKKENVINRTKIPVYDRENDLIGILDVSLDITEKKLLENALWENEEALRLVFENSPEAILWVNPETGVIIRCNRALENLLQREKKDIIGNHHATIHPLDKTAYYSSIFKRIIEDNKDYNDEADVITRSGKIIKVFFNAFITTVSRKKIIQGMLRDLTEQKKSELAVREARELAEGIVNAIRESLLILDENLLIISANNSFYKTFNVSQTDIEGKHIFDLGNGQWDIPGLRELLINIIPNATTFDNFEVKHDFPGIGKRIMLLNARKIYREGNVPNIILLAIEDITERRTIEEKLKQIREEYLTVLTHDMKGPLSIITGYLHIFNKHDLCAVSGRGLDCAKIIKSSVDVLLSMINNIINAAIIESGKSVYVFENFMLSDLIKELNSMFEVLALAGNITLSFSCPEDAWVNADRGKIRDVFYNLLNNAFRYTPSRGSITIKVSPENGMFKVKVSDTGKGIHASEHKKIFEKYGRASGEHLYNTTGVGLFIVKNIIEDHGSEITIKSAPGKGTEFSFNLQGGKS